MAEDVAGAGIDPLQPLEVWLIIRDSDTPLRTLSAPLLVPNPSVRPRRRANRPITANGCFSGPVRSSQVQLGAHVPGIHECQVVVSRRVAWVSLCHMQSETQYQGRPLRCTSGCLIAVVPRARYLILPVVGCPLLDKTVYLQHRKYQQPACSTPRLLACIAFLLAFRLWILRFC